MNGPAVIFPGRTPLVVLAAVLGLAGAGPVGCGAAVDPAASPADLVLRNGAVYTMSASRPWAASIAVRDGRLVYVGDDDGIASHVGPATRTVDLAGRMVLPGFHDAHLHAVSGGVELGECDLNDLETLDSIRTVISRCAAEGDPSTWVRGGGFSLPLFPGGNPNKALLDELVPDRPAYLTAADGHSAWVNSRALAVADVTAATPDPAAGRIERNAATGDPSGTLRESAMALVSRHLPPHTPSQLVDGLTRSLAMANRFGITSFTEANATPAYLEAYAELDRRGALTARVFPAMDTDPTRGPEQIDELVALAATVRSAMVRPGAVKVFVDGVIEGHTAALLDDYTDRPGWAGEPNWSQASLDAIVAAIDRAGLVAHMHVIGDRAIRMALDAIERAQTANGRRDARHLLVHIQLFDPEDIPRVRRLGVIASFQPLWAYPDTYITDLTEPVLGPDRSRWLYPLRSLQASGAVLAFGSDWSVSSMNPLDAIEVGLTRRPVGAAPGPAWLPDQTMDLPSMLAGYTATGAFSAFLENETGSLEVGKAADLVVLDRNLFDLPPNRIHTARVTLALVEGRNVYTIEQDRPAG